MISILFYIFIILTWIKLAFPNTACTFRYSEYIFLKELFENTGGEFWQNNENWNFSNFTTYNPCRQKWYGLLSFFMKEDSNTWCIVSINLENNNLTGTLPKIIDNFIDLMHFSVSGNHLYGPLPIFMNISNLNVVSLSGNSFSGVIPENMFNEKQLSKIVLFGVHDNTLSGTIPNWIYDLKSISNFQFENNRFSGTISKNITNLKSILTLQVQNNRFYGSIPSFDNLNRLHTILLDNNFFSGYLLKVGNINARSRLIFSATGNNLEGPLPNHYARIEQLLLSSNYFSSLIPDEICSINTLVSFSVSDNQLTGTVHLAFGSFHSFRL